MNKYSQYGEELFLRNNFQDKTGIVVEIGAADGINNSNSKMLIEMNWKALLVEPNSNNFEKLKILHSQNSNVELVNCGCSSESKKSKFYIDHNDEYQQLSTFNPKQVEKCKNIYNCEFSEVDVNLIKTSELFDNFNISKIDFLSIDTESFDLEVIKGIDFSKVEIDLICVEDSETIIYLNNLGFYQIYSTVGNIFLKKNI